MEERRVGEERRGRRKEGNKERKVRWGEKEGGKYAAGVQPRDREFKGGQRWREKT